LDLKRKESKNKKRRERDYVIERKSTTGTITPRDHVRTERGSVPGGGDETEQQRNGCKRAKKRCIRRRREPRT